MHATDRTANREEARNPLRCRAAPSLRPQLQTHPLREAQMTATERGMLGKGTLVEMARNGLSEKTEVNETLVECG